MHPYRSAIVLFGCFRGRLCRDLVRTPPIRADKANPAASRADTVNTLSAQRRPLTDRLGVVEVLLASPCLDRRSREDRVKYELSTTSYSNRGDSK